MPKNNQMLKGLNIRSFYKFLYYYSDFDGLTDHQLYVRYPATKVAFDIIVKGSTFFLINEYGNNVDVNSPLLENISFFSKTSDESRIHSIIRHLRNSIAHGNIIANGNRYVFYDYKVVNQKRRTQKETARCMVSKTIINGIINLFIEE